MVGDVDVPLHGERATGQREILTGGDPTVDLGGRRQDHVAGQDLDEDARPPVTLDAIERGRRSGDGGPGSRHGRHDSLMTARRSADDATAPNTPPCIVTILSAAS
ncbi:MAG: hypothetical protein V9G12_25535 [Microthrixaceae bacterium]